MLNTTVMNEIIRLKTIIREQERRITNLKEIKLLENELDDTIGDITNAVSALDINDVTQNTLVNERQLAPCVKKIKAHI